jgi:hypothetical protein
MFAGSSLGGSGSALLEILSPGKAAAHPRSGQFAGHLGTNVRGIPGRGFERFEKPFDRQRSAPFVMVVDVDVGFDPMPEVVLDDLGGRLEPGGFGTDDASGNGQSGRSLQASHWSLRAWQTARPWLTTQ